MLWELRQIKAFLWQNGVRGEKLKHFFKISTVFGENVNWASVTEYVCMICK